MAKAKNKNEVLFIMGNPLVVLSTLENIIKGGRVPALRGYLGTLLDIKPVLGVIDGELQPVSKKRGVGKTRKEMIKRIQDEPGIVRMGIIHTHAPEMAEEVKEAIREFYSGEILIYEAGPVLGVHAGEGAVGIALERD